MSTIELQNVTKIFKIPHGPWRSPRRGGGPPIRALDDVQLRVAAGEFVAIVGPSGSGKSTLLCAIGGMQRPDSGSVLLDDTDVYGLSSGNRARLRRDRVGFVFQTFNLIPFLTCLENVALPAILAAEHKVRATARATEQLEQLGLGERLHHRPARLSVGERQRVAIARALINHPDVVLADEPTGNLDPATGAEVVDLLCKINAEGQTIVMVTHDMSIAARAGRTVTLEAGRVLASTPAAADEDEVAVAADDQATVAADVEATVAAAVDDASTTRPVEEHAA